MNERKCQACNLKQDRSLMNVPFVIGNDELEAKFIKVGSYECRQDEFLKLLKEGQVVTECGEMISAK